jgi:hypothetical protein
MEVGAILGLHGLVPVRDTVNGWHLGTLGVGQTRHTRIAALRAPQYLVPLIGHRWHLFWRDLYNSQLRRRLFKIDHSDQIPARPVSPGRLAASGMEKSAN